MHLDPPPLPHRIEPLVRLALDVDRLDPDATIDDNLITSRVPGDLPQFNEALAKAVGLAEPAAV